MAEFVRVEKQGRVGVLTIARDQKEGMKAFLEKRAAVYQGR